MVCHTGDTGGSPAIHHSTLMTNATAIARFEVGQTYYGSLACSHGSFPVICTKRTAKCVWFEHATMPEHYPAARATIREGNHYEMANFRRWLIGADQHDTGCDMQFA